MIARRHAFLAVCLLGMIAGPTAAQEPIQFARMPDISPDGKLVAFSYLGDIWVVEAIGGVARHVTMHEKHDVYPVFSPDGRHLAFSSNRHGGYDVFVVPVQGGRPTRLTHDSADDYVTSWTPDGKRVLFSSGRSTDFPFGFGLYTVGIAGGRVERIGVMEAREGALSPKGHLLAYVSGPGTWYRKGYRGSSNDDIWICNAHGSNHKQLTRFNGQDNSPMWAPDGKAIYLVTEAFGTPANIVRQEIDAGGAVTSPPQQLTFHKDEGVRQMRLSANGEWLVYECGADLWVMSTRSGMPRRLAIEVHADDKTNPDRMVTYTSGASEFAVSPDENHIAFVVHGEIFLMPRKGGKAKRLTEHPAFDHGIAWSPDSKKLVFLSDRNGNEDIYLLEQDDAEHPELAKAHRFKIKPLTSTPAAETAVEFSPDGKRVAFLRDGKLCTMNPDGNDLKEVVSDGYVFDYQWSPDSKWLCCAKQDGSFASELYIVPATGPTAKDPVRNVTRYATYNGGVTWSKTGHKLAFIGQRRQGQGSVCVLSLQRPAAAGAPSSSEFDWDDIHLRVRMPVTGSVMECAISNDGNKVAVRAQQEGDDLWVASSDGQTLTRLTNSNYRPTQIQWSRYSPTTVYFRDRLGSIRSISTGGGLPGFAGLSGASSAQLINFTAKMTIKRDEQFAEMFDQSWRALHEHFYDPNFHGANWKAVRDKYRPLVKHCALKEDLYALISLMLGELNASHLGIVGFLGAPEQTTADLGLLFDSSFKGPGLRVSEILKRGPADQRGINIKPGDIVLSIDRVDINEQTELEKLLNDKVGETISLQVVTPQAPPSKGVEEKGTSKAGEVKGPLKAGEMKRRRVEIVGGSRSQIANLMYERWVENNARRVAELSKGRLGYIHIPSMDDAGLDRFVRSLYSDCFDKDAVVIDVRYNGGGYTHDQVLNYLGGKEHTAFHQRHGGQGFVLNFQDRKWSKPAALLINNRSYSDAEIFPHAFRTLGLGKLIGQATGGHVIGTRNITLIDGSTFRTPRIGVHTVKGVNMEKEGVAPDIAVEQTPDDLARGYDLQLAKAVEALQQDVIAWKRSRGNMVQSGAPSPSVPGSSIGIEPKKN